MEDLDRDKIFNEHKRSIYLWFLHCERTYKRGEFRKLNELQMCPYEGCDGDTVIDAINWDEIREIHPNYPVIPIEDVIYLGND